MITVKESSTKISSWKKEIRYFNGTTKAMPTNCATSSYSCGSRTSGESLVTTPNTLAAATTFRCRSEGGVDWLSSNPEFEVPPWLWTTKARTKLHAKLAMFGREASLRLIHAVAISPTFEEKNSCSHTSLLSCWVAKPACTPTWWFSP